MDILTQKKCITCGEWKGREEFYKRSGSRDGLVGDCKSCFQKKSHKRYVENPYPARARSKKWREENRDRHANSLRLWLSNNVERKRATSSAWSAKNAARVRETSKKYKIEHAETLRQKDREWKRANIERKRASDRNRRALKKGSNGKITAKQWLALKEFYGYTCLACGYKEPEIKLTLDHVVPLVLGGSHSIDNAQPLCLSCNCSKGTRVIDYRTVRYVAE
jgi:5-methylcytosine-specific restriction endonuclease McrA